MRISFLSIVVWIVSIEIIHAQPALDSTFRLTQNLQYYLYASTFPAPTLGPSQTWNLSVGTGHFSDPYTLIQGSGVPTLMGMDTARFRMDFPGSGVRHYLYYAETDSGLYHIGEEDFDDVQHDSAYRLFEMARMEFPYDLAYGRSRITQSRYADSVPRGRIKRYAVTDTLTYAGYGSLAYDGNAYPSAVLILHRLSLRQTGLSSSDSLLYHQEIRSLWIPGTGRPVYEYVRETRGTAVTETGSYMRSLRVGTRAHISGLRLFPNPAHTQIYIQADNSGTIMCINTLSQVWELPIVQGKADVSILPHGIYTVTIGAQQARFVKE